MNNLKICVFAEGCHKRRICTWGRLNIWSSFFVKGYNCLNKKHGFDLPLIEIFNNGCFLFNIAGRQARLFYIKSHTSNGCLIINPK